MTGSLAALLLPGQSCLLQLSLTQLLLSQTARLS